MLHVGQDTWKQSGHPKHYNAIILHHGNRIKCVHNTRYISRFILGSIKLDNNKFLQFFKFTVALRHQNTILPSAHSLSLLFSLLLLELHLSAMHHRPSQLVNAYLFLCIETQDVNGGLRKESTKTQILQVLLTLSTIPDSSSNKFVLKFISKKWEAYIFQFLILQPEAHKDNRVSFSV